MQNSTVESHYPLSFMEEETKRLGQHLKNRHVVVLIGMKRVGISSFLRFFLNHKDLAKNYISDENHLFITVDLNDLVEREIFPFWILTLKRIADTIQKSNLNKQTKKYIESLFLDSIQTNDLFLLTENVRKAILRIVEANALPSIFFVHFDRIKDAATNQFFDNLQGLIDASHQKLSFVFTSFQSLDRLSPTVFTKQALASFSHDMYIKPLRNEDIQIIFATYKNRYKLILSADLEQALFDVVDGYVQYLHLSLINLHEQKLKRKEKLFERLIKDERISLQSEELWESLDDQEKQALIDIVQKKLINEQQTSGLKYLFDTGFIEEQNSKLIIFSPLFEYFVTQRQKKVVNDLVSVELSKKEHSLFSLLKASLAQVCEREKIIEAVWPEVDTLGVSDWAIDRLVARLRNKLKLQKNPYEIVTVKTRGYKLINNG